MNSFVATTARCTKCGRAPNIRVNDRERDRYRHEDPEYIVQTVHCRCGEVYPVKAKDIQEAA